MSRVERAMSKTIKAFFIISSMLLLGCSISEFEVKGFFPEPVINKLPLIVGVIYDPKFYAYKYIEQDKQRKEREIGFGKAQVQLFDIVLSAMFDRVIPKKEVQALVKPSVDLYFYPVIEEFQYNLPDETKINVYEVWVKYHFKVFDAQGQLIADWIQTAYGKTPSGMFKSQEKALNEAMIVALRDLGASLSLRFTRVPEINNWLKQRRQIFTFNWSEHNCGDTCKLIML